MRLKLGNFDPLSWSPLFFVDYLQGVTETLGEVTAWADLSDNANPLNKFSAYDGPTLIADGMLFSATSILETSQNIGLNVDGSPFSMNFVVSIDIAGATLIRNLLSLENNTLFRNSISNRENISLIVESIFTPTARNYNEFYGITFTYDGTTFYIYRDGVLIFTKVTAIDADAIDGLLAMGTTAGTYAFTTKGLLLFNEFLSPEKVEILTGWSAHYYELAWKLDGSHKYKEVSP